MIILMNDRKGSAMMLQESNRVEFKTTLNDKLEKEEHRQWR
jgi:hypothetical protein